MQRLILMRHAQAEAGASGGDDIDRRLTDAGRADARLIGRALMDEHLTPDVALVSAATRTQETWAALSEKFPHIRVQVRQSLYLAGANVIREAADQVGAPGETLMILAHNPGIHDCAMRLLRDDSAPPSVLAKLERGFPPATAVAFTVDEAGRYAYDGVFYVRDYGGGGRE